MLYIHFYIQNHIYIIHIYRVYGARTKRFWNILKTSRTHYYSTCIVKSIRFHFRISKIILYIHTWIYSGSKKGIFSVWIIRNIHKWYDGNSLASDDVYAMHIIDHFKSYLRALFKIHFFFRPLTAQIAIMNFYSEYTYIYTNTYIILHEAQMCISEEAAQSH